MEDTKEAIRQWAARGCDKTEGAETMRLHHPNRAMAMSARHMTAEKITYELLKLYGIDPQRLWNTRLTPIESIREHDRQNNKTGGTRDTTPRQTPAAQAAPRTKAARGQHTVVPAEKETGTLTDESKKLARDLTAEISALHEKAFATGTANTAKAMHQRRKTNDRKLELIARREELHHAREEAYATGKTERLRKAMEEGQRQEREATARPEPETLTDTELTKAYHNTTTAIRRRMNLLEYSKNTRAAKPDPMPQGMRRRQTEKELEELKAYRSLLGDEIKRRKL